MIPDVFGLIAKIRERPEMYFVDPSAEKLQIFVNGWLCDRQDIRSGKALIAFQYWLAERYGLFKGTSWSQMAAYKTVTQLQSFTFTLEQLWLFEAELRSGKVDIDNE
jgi:hypothetical protein